MDKHTALENLLLAKDSIEKIGKTYFLVDGTLLGFIRENDFIDHDQDIDIGVFAYDFSYNDLLKLVVELDRRGFKPNHFFGNFGQAFEASFIRGGVKLDIFFYHQKPETVYYHAFLNGCKNIERDTLTYEYPIKHFVELECRPFGKEQLHFNVPSQPEKVLEIKYGKDWKTPKTKWDWAYSPLNRVIT